MLYYKDIKLKDQTLDFSIKNLLNIKDSNIFFSNVAIQTEQIHNRLTHVFYGVLSAPLDDCPYCGHSAFIKHSFDRSDIQLLPFQEGPAVLRLFKQRFQCKSCHHTFTSQTNFIAKHCSISQPLKFAIALKLKKKLSMKEIADEYFVSVKTVERVLDSFYKEFQVRHDYLPKNLLFDEFKGTKDSEGAMCFIVSDAETGKIFDILDDRRNFQLIRYFQRFSLEARLGVQQVVMDMNASYPSVVNAVFPNASIVIDRFHIIQQLSKALNHQRIQSMNQLKKGDSEQMKDYRKLKRYWRIFLKKQTNLDYKELKPFPLFNYKYMTESEVLDYLLTIDPVLKKSYEVYQELLEAYDDRDAQAFFDCIDHLPKELDKAFKKSVSSLKKYRKGITNAFASPFSNGKLEGKNNLIKVIKRVAFGFRTFKNLRRRVLIQQGILEVV